MTDGIWTPGAPQPSLDDFVARIHRRVERFAKEHGDGQATVQVELSNGSTLRLLSIEAEPGYGFVTLTPYRDPEPPEQVIVPVGAIARITLGAVEEHPPFGFAAAPPPVE